MPRVPQMSDLADPAHPLRQPDPPERVAYSFHPVCGVWFATEKHAEHTQHLVYVGGQPGEQTYGLVGMRELMQYAVEFAEPTAASGYAEAAQIAADKEAGERLLALTPDAKGYALVDDETFAAMKRMVDDARDYAVTCGYANDETCEPVERAAAGFALVCWTKP